MKFASATHVGKIRKVNEDNSYIPAPEAELEYQQRFFAVADGMGGHSAGEVASALAVRSMLNYLAKPGKWADAALDPIKVLKDAIDATNKKIYMLGTYSDKCANMGTTITCALCYDDRWVIGHVGDSRAYLIREGRAEQVTQDHSMVEELVAQGLMEKDSAEYIMQRHIITRALGVRGDEYGDCFPLMAKEGDALLLCSDGLSENVSLEEIASYCTDLSPEDACEQLKELALVRSGSDNITLCLCKREEVCDG